MNVGSFTTTGTKGQIVIPNDYRKSLGITPDTLLSLSLVGGGVYIQPVTVIPSKVIYDDGAFLDFLARYRGFWGKETKEEKAQRLESKKMEIKRAKKLSRVW